MSIQITVVVPAHNEENFLPGLFASLNKYVHEPIELVVVDNGSMDSSGKLATEHGGCLVRVEGKVFPSVARNIGVLESRGKILVFLDADVEVTEEWGRELALQKEVLLQNPLIVTGDQYHISRRPGWIERYWFEPLRSKSPAYINGGNLITTREVFDKIKGFDVNKETGEDVDFCQRAIAAGAEMQINKKFFALHEGYPKTVKRFVERERWHGVGDFQGFQSVVKSKIAMTTLLFLFVHVSIVCTAIQSAVVGLVSIPLYVSMAGLVGICIFSSAYRFSRAGLKYILVGVLISYLYYLGRAFSAIDVGTKKLGR